MSTYSQAFYSKWAATAQEESKRSGIPASVILAQAMIESKSGDGAFLSKLADTYNNFFGIKKAGKNPWTGQTVVMVSGEEVNGANVPQASTFRVYTDAADSWKDHTDFLLTNPTYTKNGVFSSNDPFTVATALQKAGYATNSNYANDIMKVINGSNLTQYDTGTAPIGDPALAPSAGVSNPGTGNIGNVSLINPSGQMPGGNSSTGGGFDFGIGSMFGVNFDAAATTLMFLVLGAILIGLGLFIAFSPTTGAISSLSSVAKAVGSSE